MYLKGASDVERRMLADVPSSLGLVKSDPGQQGMKWLILMEAFPDSNEAPEDLPYLALTPKRVGRPWTISFRNLGRVMPRFDTTKNERFQVLPNMPTLHDIHVQYVSCSALAMT